MTSTPEQIEELIKPFGFSLTQLPKPGKAFFAYESKDRTTARSMAMHWEDDSDPSKQFCEDFICHQSDVIEILVSCLAQATHKAVWIKMTGMMPPEYTGHYECSNCKWHGSHHDNTIETKYKYCPNCGAKMENAI